MSTLILDCQNEMHGGMRALEGLCDLLWEANGADKRQFNVVGPEGLAELVSLVQARFKRAEKLLDSAADAAFGR